MRRRTIRPSSRHALVLLISIIAIVGWAIWEVGRSRVGRVLVLSASGAVFLFFALGWASK